MITIVKLLHPGLQLGDHLLGQTDLAGGVASHPATQQYMRFILQKRDEAQLRISARSPAGGWTPKLVFVLLGVGDIQRAALQADQSPVRYRAPRVFSEAIGTTTCSYSRRKGSAPRRDRACETPLLPVARTVSPGLVSHWMPSSKQRFPTGRLHVEHQHDHVVHHEQFSLSDAGLASQGQDRIDPLSRNRSIDPPQN